MTKVKQAVEASAANKKLRRNSMCHYHQGAAWT